MNSEEMFANIASLYLPKKDLQAMVENISDSRVSFEPFTNKKIPVFDRFVQVYVDGVKQMYAACVECRTLIKYTARDGTRGLHHHSCPHNRQRKSAKYPSQLMPIPIVSELPQNDILDKNGDDGNGSHIVVDHDDNYLLDGMGSFVDTPCTTSSSSALNIPIVHMRPSKLALAGAVGIAPKMKNKHPPSPQSPMVINDYN